MRAPSVDVVKSEDRVVKDRNAVGAAVGTGRPTFLSLFSGIGGLDLGLERAGFRLIGSVEDDEVARGSLKANRDAWYQIPPHDIRNIAGWLGPSELGLETGELDLLAGAPPCQPFSMAAQWSRTGRAGLDDRRGTLIHDVLELVATLQPKLVVLENVAGFVRGPTSALSFIQDSLNELNSATGCQYELSCEILDANAYGVAQTRKRAIVMLSRIGKVDWPLPAPTAQRPVAWDAIGGLEDPEAKGLKATGSYGALLPSIPEGQNYQWHTERGGGLPLFGYRTRYWSFLLKLAKAQPAWTLAAQPGPSTGPFHWDSRPLTVREMLLLQSFPGDWRVEGNRREQVRQVGNATPPALAERIGLQLGKALSGRVASPSLGHKRSGKVPPPKRRSSVPSEYHDRVGDHPAHLGAGLGPAPRA